MPSHGHSADGAGLTVRFWGTRGSLPAPGPRTVRYGGNTPCVEIRGGDAVLILDAGSGLRALGDALLKEGVREIHLLLSHYHWDHIMGLPFFRPLFDRSAAIHLHGESKRGRDVRDLLAGQMIAPYFPVGLSEEDRAALHPHPVTPGDRFRVGDVEVTAARLDHPDGVLGWRLERAGRAITYATDVEHRPDGPDPALVALAQGADLLVYDATFTEAEYPRHRGWGHSTWEAGVAAARAAGARRLVLFHHLPERTDDALAELERAAAEALPGTVAAREGMVLHLPPLG